MVEKQYQEKLQHDMVDKEAKLAAEKRAADMRTIENIHIVEPDEEDEKWELVNERKQSYTLPPRPPRGSQIAEVNSILPYVT
jgi:hypothetical protein